VTVDDEQAEQAQRQLARMGLLVELSSAVVLHGARELVRQTESGTASCSSPPGQPERRLPNCRLRGCVTRATATGSVTRPIGCGHGRALGNRRRQ
jgi:hypothetical protein